jgi:hypothetical protein
MMQCLAQGLPVSVRKGGGKAGDALAPLLQLPCIDQELLKKLRKRKINSLAGERACATDAQQHLGACNIYLRVVVGLDGRQALLRHQARCLICEARAVVWCAW